MHFFVFSKQAVQLIEYCNYPVWKWRGGGWGGRGGVNLMKDWAICVCLLKNQQTNNSTQVVFFYESLKINMDISFA